MKKEFLDLGRQPIANKFLREDEFKDEFFYNLKVVFDDDTKLVSLKDFVKPELMFNDDYVYHTSLSVPMIKHFKETAEMLMKEFNPLTVMEIGSNDGVFLKNRFAQQRCFMTKQRFMTMQICKYAICKYANMQICKYANM